MTVRDEEKDWKKSYSVSFDGKDGKWKAYHLKTEATGKKKKWWDVIQTARPDKESEDVKALRDAAGYYFAMTCDDVAEKYIKANKSDPYLMWKALMKRYEDVDSQDLKTLYEKLNEIVNNGPGLEDPTLWFYAIDEAEINIVTAGGQKKQEADLLSVLTAVMESNQHYKEITTHLRTQKNDKLEFHKEEYYDVWKRELKSLSSKKSKDDVAYITVGNYNGGQRARRPPGKNSWKPFKGTCHGCGGQGHRIANCPKKTRSGPSDEMRRCYNCGDRGHLSRACPKKRNARPSTDGAQEALFVGMTLCKPVSAKPKTPKDHSKSWYSLCEDDSDDEDDDDDGVIVEHCAMVIDMEMVTKENVWEDIMETPMLHSLLLQPGVLDGLLHEDESSVDSSMPSLLRRENPDESDSDDDRPRTQIRRHFDDSSDDSSGDDVPGCGNILDVDRAFAEGWEEAMMIQNPHSSSSDDDEDDDEPQIGYCWECGGSGYAWNYCEGCEDRGILLEPIEVPEDLVRFNEQRNMQITEDPEERIALMREHGIGMCVTCRDIGHFDSLCVKCFEPGVFHTYHSYDHIEETLQKGQGWCARCRRIGDVGGICECSHGIYARVLTRPKDGEELNDEALCALTLENNSKANLFLLDSGSTTHIVTDASRLNDVVACEQEVMVGNGKHEIARVKGWMTVHLAKNKKLILHDVLALDTFMVNVISVDKLCQHGTEVTWAKKEVSLKSPEGAVVRMKKRRNGMCYLQCIGDPKPTIGTDTVLIANNKSKPNPKRMDLNEAHQLLGHPSEAIVRQTLKHWNVDCVGVLGSCKGCLEEKAQRKSVAKQADNNSEIPGERLLLDTTGPYSPSLRGSVYDVYIEDQATKQSWLYNVKKRTNVPICAEDTLRWCKGHGYNTKFLRCDNAGEHQKKLQAICDEYGVQIEYTARDTPQQNGQVERTIAIDRGRRNAMLNMSGLTSKEQSLLRAEATQMLRRVTMMHATERRPTPPSIAMPRGSALLEPRHLRRFGQPGFVTTRKKIMGKMEKRSIPMYMVGYAPDHPPDTYRMYDRRTASVVQTRDVAWPGPTPTIPTTNIPDEAAIPTHPHHIIPPDDSDSDDDTPPSTSYVGRNEVNDQPDARTGRNDDEKEDAGRNDARISTRSTRRNPQLETQHHNNPKAQRELERLGFDVSFGKTNQAEVSDDDDQEETTAMVMSVSHDSDPGEPSNIKQALEGQDAEKWKISIKEEINNFLKRGAWVRRDKRQIERKGYRPIGTKTVFKVKNEQDGSLRYKTRIVTLGYNMIPGVHFNNSYSPVGTDTSVRMLIGTSLYVMNLEEAYVKRDTSRFTRTKAPGRKGEERWNQRLGEIRKPDSARRFGVHPNMDKDNPWVLEVFDVEAAFLNADPGVKLFIKVPEAMVKLGMITQEEADEMVYELTTTMYGNVDAALRFFIKYKGILLKLGFIQLKSDPCVFYKENSEKEITILLVTHVDDTLTAGRKKDVDQFLEEFETHLKIERLGTLKKHLGVWWEWCLEDEKEIYLKGSMEKMRKSIVQKYKEATGHDAKSSQTPGIPGSVLTKFEEEPVQMTEFRSILGQMLYFMTKLAPPLVNPTRELSSHMSRPGPDHWEAMGRAVGYLGTHSKYELTLRAPEELRGIHISDAEYAKCAETRRSVGGGIDTLGGMIIDWESKKQPIVSLSTAEAELIAYCVRCQQAQFVQHWLKEVLNEKKASIIFEDNQGCIYLIKNQKAGGRTKHVDVRYMFVRDLYINGSVIPKFCRSLECIADGCTKNQPQKLFCEHANVLMNGLLPYRREDVEDAIQSEESNTERQDG